MNIKKSDIISIAKTVQSQNLDRQKPKDINQDLQVKASSPETNDISLNTLKTRVLGIQQEMKTLQTEISGRQMQVSFLETLENKGNWFAELQTFMKETFEEPANQQTPTWEEYTSQRNKEIATLQNSLLQKEVQMQNILSAGVFGSDTEVILSRDAANSADIFNSLTPEAVKTLINS